MISPTEKQGLKDEIARIDGDKSEITANYTKYGLGTPTAYNSAHSAYRAVLVTLSASSPETITIPSDFATKQTAYYTARTNALTAIAEKAKQVADAAQTAADNAQTAADNAMDKYNNLQIGVRNLLLKSNVELGDNYYQFGRYYFHTNDKYALKKGKIYTLVLCYTLGENNTHINAYWRGGNNSPMSHLFQTRGDRVIESFTQEFNGDDTANTYLPFYQFPDGTFGSKVHWAVLVEGNKAPNMWVAAPEDQAASDAQEAATAAQSDATEAKTELNQINSDSVISPVEKTALKQQQADIQAEYNEIIADAGRYSISTTAYKNAYTSANNALTKYTATSPTYITVGSDYANIAAYYDARQTILNSIAAAAKKASDDAMQAAEDEAELAKWRAIGYSWNSGKPLWTDDPTFKTGTNRLGVYNNSGNAAVTITREAKQSDSPVSDSEYNLKIVCSGGGTPNNGGFLRQVMTRANAVFVFRFIAKLPEGTGFDFNYNNFGTGQAYKWVTSRNGTGRFEEYICVAKCGATGSFSTIGYFSIWGTAPVTCYLAYAGAFDVTAGVSTGEQLQTVSGTVVQLDGDFQATKKELNIWKEQIETDFTALEGTTKEQVENAVLNLQKGMRNLVRQGKYDISSSTAYLVKDVQLTKDLVEGNKYTIVIKATLRGDQDLDVYEHSAMIRQTTFIKSDFVSGAFARSFTYNAYSDSTNKSVLRIYNMPSESSAANPMDLEWVCLYEGDITDAAPDYFVNAPEDLNLEIDSVKTSVSDIEQRADSITLRVSATETKVDEAQAVADAAQDAANDALDRTLPTWRGWIDVTQDADGNPLDENKYYPLTIRLSLRDYTNIRLKVNLNSGTTPSWSTHHQGFTVNCEWNAISSGWGVNPEPLREIIDYSRAFTNAETLKIDNEDVTRTIEPAASIGQLAQYGYEYIYLRGGGKYYFEIQGITYNSSRTEFAAQDIQLHTTTFVPSSSYPDYKIEVLTPEDITIIERTNVTKTEYTAGINNLADKVELYATKKLTFKDGTQEVVDEGNLQVGFDAINGYVGHYDKGTGKWNKSGFMVKDSYAGIFSGKANSKDSSIVEVLSSVEVYGNTAAISAAHVVITGETKFVTQGGSGSVVNIFSDKAFSYISGSTHQEVFNINNGVFAVSDYGDVHIGKYSSGGAGILYNYNTSTLSLRGSINITSGSISINNGVFKVTNTGAMTATSGTIGGFAIGSSYIGAAGDVESKNGFSLYRSFLKFRDTDHYVAIGLSTFAGSTAYTPIGRFENTEVKGETQSQDNVCLYLNATGCPETYKDAGKNYAIWIEKGHIYLKSGYIRTGALISNSFGYYSGGTVTPSKTSLLITFSNDITLSGSEVGNGHIIICVNTSSSERNIYGTVSGKVPVSSHRAMLLVYYNGWYAQSDKG